MKQQTDKNAVWDIGIRLFHWSLVVLVALAWFFGNDGEMERHETVGLAILTLLVFRILWGIIGSKHARFSDFIRGPSAIKQYLQGQYDVKGHNPLGGLSVVLLIALLAVQVFSGLMNADDIYFEGPLYQYVSEGTVETASAVHGWVFNTLLAIIALHIIAVIVYRLKGKNLIKPMITGYAEDYSGDEAPKKSWMIILVAIISAAIVWVPYQLYG